MAHISCSSAGQERLLIFEVHEVFVRLLAMNYEVERYKPASHPL